MAAVATTVAQAELISSLSQDDIPIKLRCAICSRLAVNAFRLPCCEQAICETCQSTLPSSCPVCEHTPVAAEDCKPLKSLRTTIKVFLRTEEKKREALRSKEAKISPPATPVEVAPTPIQAPAPTEPFAEPDGADKAEVQIEASTVSDQVEGTPANLETTEQSEQAEQDIPQPSIEEIAPGQEPTKEIDVNQEDATPGDEDGKDANGLTTGHDISQTGFGAGFGFDPSAAGGFPAMGFGGGDMNQMQQMQMMMAMQNGMAPNTFNNFPMMGISGMSMDPMMMQNMFMNGGYGATGMNGMNMGMGVGGGFDGGVGGFNNGWNGQQSWNVGPDNFNHPNAAGMGNGDYGSNNSGYSHATGYNQGNYGRGNQYNDYQNQNNYGGYQSRGRGRGRGGFSRGGYNGYGSNEAYSQQFPSQFGSGQGTNGPISETGSIPTGPKAAAASAEPSNVDEFGREIRQPSEVKNASVEPTSKDDQTPALTAQDDGTEVKNYVSPQDSADKVEDSAPKPILTLDEAEAVSYPQNGMYNGAASRGGFASGFSGRGNFNSMQPPIVKPIDVPINAPTGPKAMREGLPNTGLSGLRSRGFSAASGGISRPNGSVSVAPEPDPSEYDGKDREKSRSPSRDRSRSRDRKRSRSRDRHHRRHRHRSNSLSENDKESERRRQRRKERRRRREDEGDDGEGDRVAEDRDVDEERSRSASPSDSRRSSHRSRRDRDKYRERDKESDREHKSSSHKHRSSHRHHDDRSRSRDRDREHRHRHSRRGSEDIEGKVDKVDRSIPPTPIESEDPSRRPSIVSSPNGANGIEIKGTSSRRKPTLDEIVIPTGPRQDRDRISSSTREKYSDTGKENRYHRDEESRHRSSRHRDSDRDREKERERVKDKREGKPPTPTAPAVQDPHTLEREARDRERLLKEAQRIAGLTGMGGGRKRSRDDGDDRKGKKKRGRGAGDESEESRIARLEAERESARWG